MNKKTDFSPKKLKQLKQILDRSLTRLDKPVLARLQVARTRAVANHAHRRVAPALSWAGNITWESVTTHYKPHLLAATVLLAAVLFSTMSYWPQPAETDNTQVDISILTDDLPMHVYLD